MLCVTERVWKTDGGEDLIRFSDGRYQVVPAGCNVKKLRELGEAIDDLLKSVVTEEDAE